VLAAAGLLAACSSDDDPERGLDAIDTPAFEPADGGQARSSTTTAGSPGSPGTPTAPGASGPASVPAAGSTGDVPGAPGTTAVAGTDPAPPREVVSFDDPIGDAVGGLDQDPPPWSDLAGGSLERQDGVYRLAVELGDEAPQAAPGSETMNIATFFDVDGDGDVDHEIWVNLDGEGWGPVRYDDQGTVAPGQESGVTIEVIDRSVTLVFSAPVIGAPERLRFSIASEYGDLEVIGSDFARRDDAPDDDRAVSFP